MDFTYDEKQALQGGMGAFVENTGAYKGKIIFAEWISTSAGAEALKLTFETDQGERADYLNIYYQGKDGLPIDFGVKMIQAVMGVTGVRKLSRLASDSALICPELNSKPIGLFLQKVLYTKQDGSDGYRFQIIVPFSPKSEKTLAEFKNGEDAKRIVHLSQTMRDKDEREKPKRGRPPKKENAVTTVQQDDPLSAFHDDEIPF